MAKAATKKSAKKSTSQEVATVDESAQLPSFLKHYEGSLGTENIGVDEVAIPRLKIGQGTSPEVKDKLVEEGDLFINITGQVVAKAGEKLRVIPVVFTKEFILWKDRQFEGGGIMARAHKVAVDGGYKYKWDNPNTEFKNKIKGVQAVTWKTGAYIEDDGLNEWGSEIPGDPQSKKAATEHHNYVFILPDHDNMVVSASLSRTQTKRAKQFNSALTMSTHPIFGRIFTVVTETENKNDNSWKNYRFQPAGFVQDEALFKMAEDLHKQFSESGFAVDLSDQQDDAEDIGSGERDPKKAF